MSWRLAKSLAQLSREIDARWPGTTIWSIGDQSHAARASDHNPNGAGVVCAIDVLGHKQSDALWTFLKDARDGRVKYSIHDQRIMSATVSPWQPRRYSGSNPHTNHIHISVGRGRDGYSTRGDLYDDRSPWGLTTTEPEDDSMLTRGDTGPAVKLFQNALIAEAKLSGRSGGDPLPTFGADGDYGAETERAVKAYQKGAQVPVSGNVDGLTAALLVRYSEHHR